MQTISSHTSCTTRCCRPHLLPLLIHLPLLLQLLCCHVCILVEPLLALLLHVLAHRPAVLAAAYSSSSGIVPVCLQPAGCCGPAESFQLFCEGQGLLLGHLARQP